MESTAFESWLADIFGQGPEQISLLLKDPTAVQFLITWSIFETRFFDRYMTIKKIQPFAEQRTSEHFDGSSINKSAEHFHARYSKYKKLYKNLLHISNSKCIELPEIDKILKLAFDKLDAKQILLLSTFVVYRFRNNIFHGNKGVTSWLEFKEQIGHCTHIMQQLITQAEKLQPQLKIVRNINPVTVSPHL